MMIWPFASLTEAYVAMKAGLESLKETGVSGASKELTPRFLFEVNGLKQSMGIDEHAGGSAFANVAYFPC